MSNKCQHGKVNFDQRNKWLKQHFLTFVLEKQKEQKRNPQLNRFLLPHILRLHKGKQRVTFSSDMITIIKDST